MVNLTIDECQKFVFRPINYDKEESEIRDKNKNIIDDFLYIISDKECLSILKSENNYDLCIPAKMIRFYNKYFNENGKSEDNDNRTILSKLKHEYSDLSVKVENFSNKWGYEENFVWCYLLDNDKLFRLFFVKDPGKQTFHQHLAAKWINNLPFVNEFKELSVGGKDALYVLDGKVINGEKKKEVKDKTIPKSIDFYWNYQFSGKKIEFYATHKYTKISGGSQDNQYRDVQNFLAEAKSCDNINICFVSITDGPYYLLSEPTASNMRKIDYLNSQLFCNKSNIATNLDCFMPSIISRIIIWLKENFEEKEISEEIEKLNILASKIK